MVGFLAPAVRVCPVRHAHGILTLRFLMRASLRRG